ncbi:hypothetical protein BB559_002140 [Furculomyces boomerangus]|uniref:chitin synthase n=2 Tax=Harpellales TaxID=61421 RepID=A0A2T9YXT0_9FUNG|nr:hypothetical protein BB559_002140 [Furculomyces boomerangus]PVZ99983.1 hypothetical protein BB558_003978 [Smittium angustum]
MFKSNSKDNKSDLSKGPKAGATNDDDVTKRVIERFEQNEDFSPYTQIGSRVLISVNPHEQLDINGDQTAKLYVDDFKNTSKGPKKTEPHIFKVVESSYLYMKQTEINQSIIFLGESGSGKTEQRRLAIKMLSMMKNTKKNLESYKKILASDIVTEAFTHAFVGHKNASRAGIYQELQFSETCELIGCKSILYMLEATRVSKVGTGEKNFNVFHYLANGAGEMREELGIDIGGGVAYEYLKKAELEKKPEGEDESSRFLELIQAMKVVGIGGKIRRSVFKVLIGILALGNVHFKKNQHSYREEIVAVGLEDVVSNLGVDSAPLQELLTNKTQQMGRQRVEMILGVEAAIERRDELARVVYKQLVNWILETINQQLCVDDGDRNTFTGLVDMPGYSEGKKFGFYRLVYNYINERMRHFMMHQVFSMANEDYASEGVKVVAVVKNSDRTECLDLFIRAPTGLFPVMDRQAQAMIKGNKKEKEFDPEVSEKEACSQLHQVFTKGVSENKYFGAGTSKNDLNQFNVQHFWGSVSYVVDGFVGANTESANGDFSGLFIGDRYNRGSKNNFVAGLFSSTGDSSSREPTKSAKRNSKMSTLEKDTFLVTSMQRRITKLVSTLDDTLPWFVICIKPNERGRPRIADSKYIKAQVRSYNLGDVARRKRVEFAATIKHEDFCMRYEDLLSDNNISTVDTKDHMQKCEKIKAALKMSDSDMYVGKTKVFMSFNCWRQMEDPLRRLESEENESMNNDKNSQYSQDENGIAKGYEKDFFGSVGSIGEEEEDFEDDIFDESKEEIIDETEDKTRSMTASRIVWLKVVNLLTWLIPTFAVAKFSASKRKDQQLAWREKLALCMIIFYCCGLVIFWIGGLGLLICPKQHVFSVPELRGYDKPNEALINIRGEVFDISGYSHKGISFKYLIDRNYFGKDLSYMFPFQLSYVCPGMGIDPRLSMDYKPIIYSDAYFHDHRWYRHADEGEAYNYYQFHLMRILRQSMSKGSVAYDPKVLLKESQGTVKNDPSKSKYRSIIRGEVFDLSDYINSDGAPYVVTPDGISNDTVTVENRNFLSNDIRVLFESNPGKDVTKQWEIFEKVNPRSAKIHYQCLRGAFYIGKVDLRKSLRCYVANYMLLSGSIFIVTMIFFKFIASIRFGTSKEPEALDMFVVCNVPCYTEGEESLRGTIDSIARLRYDDKRKLLFIVCDGMIMGSGNDRPTPRIVLDILGVDPGEDSEALSYVALGDGMKQHNMAKVYSGLYEVAGHAVPYIVVAKCGTPFERSKPGNRGKRDSQILLMRFFNKVHFNTPMTPLELEIFHQIKNIIGVNPSFYEYLLMVDADTFVYPDSMNRLVSGMQNDVKIMGLCGETRLANSKGSWTTMMQVYEYFIAHYLSKAFESLFGTVTCLPGCFCMYRIRTPEESPLLISDDMIRDYSTNNADTLHKKNLLYLGEDRYLTTLMLKHFPNYKTKFVADAKCDTNAPDSWRVLLSQRRRWINSTVHNLLELMFLPNMCGFCCFSMRFVVFIDLISTVIMPATLAYLGILAYQLSNTDSNTSYLSLYLLAAIYGMQGLVFIIHKQWQHIGWMIIYLMAIPLFSFVIPVYAFWHFDDFSWGNTRVVVGEKGQKILVNASDAEKFDPSIIPMRKWSDYEKDLAWEIKTSVTDDQDISSQFGGVKPRVGSAVGNIPRSVSRLMGSAQGSHTDSVYMPETAYGYNKNDVGNYGLRFSTRFDPEENVMNDRELQVNRVYENTLRNSMLSDGFRVPTPNSFVGQQIPTNNPMQIYQNPNRNTMLLQNRSLQNMNSMATIDFGQPQAMQNQQFYDPSGIPVMPQTLGRMSYHQMQSIPHMNSMSTINQGNMVGNTNMNRFSSVYDNNLQQGIGGDAAFVANLSAYMGDDMGMASSVSGNPNQPQQRVMANQQQQGFDSTNIQQPGNENGTYQTQQWASGIQDATIRAAVSQVLDRCDLNSVSKKNVRDQAANMLGISAEELKARKETFNTMIIEELMKKNA